MIVSCLKKVGVTPNTKIIIAVDSKKGNWRKQLDPNYKSNRKEAREKHDFDWNLWFRKYSYLVNNIEESTPFYTVEIENLEADDIIAVGCKLYKENECVVISSDQDYEQLVALGNVKIFSPVTKQYKNVKNPYAILSKKIEKEVSDNLITPISNEEEYNVRNTLVNLIDLPEWVNTLVTEKLSILPEKDFDTNLLLFKSMREKVKQIYNSNNIVDYEKSINRKKRRKKSGKQRLLKM